MSLQDLPGLGAATAKKLQKVGIASQADLVNITNDVLQKKKEQFKSVGLSMKAVQRFMDRAKEALQDSSGDDTDVMSDEEPPEDDSIAARARARTKKRAIQQKKNKRKKRKTDGKQSVTRSEKKRKGVESALDGVKTTSKSSSSKASKQKKQKLTKLQVEILDEVIEDDDFDMKEEVEDYTRVKPSEMPKDFKYRFELVLTQKYINDEVAQAHAGNFTPAEDMFQAKHGTYVDEIARVIGDVVEDLYSELCTLIASYFVTEKKVDFYVNIPYLEALAELHNKVPVASSARLTIPKVDQNFITERFYGWRKTPKHLPPYPARVFPYFELLHNLGAHNKVCFVLDDNEFESCPPPPISELELIELDNALEGHLADGTELFQYQQATIAWMKSIEAGKPYEIGYGDMEFSYLDKYRKRIPTNVLIDYASSEVYVKGHKEITKPRVFTSKGGILADACGLGKTLTVLAHCLADKPKPRFGSNGRAAAIRVVGQEQFYTEATLVVCPSQLASQWFAEMKRHTPNAKGHIVTTKTTHGLVSYMDVIEADFIFVSRDFLKGTWCRLRNGNRHKIFENLLKTKVFDEMSPVLRHFYWRRIVCDEGHEYPRIPQAYEAKFKWYVSATPFPGREYIADILNFLELKLNDNGSRLSQWLESPLGVKVLEFMKTIYTRNTKETIGDENWLPDTVEDTTFLDMDPTERAIYELALFREKDENTCLALCSHPSLALVRYDIKTLKTISIHTLRGFSQALQSNESMIKHVKERIIQGKKYVAIFEREKSRCEKQGVPFIARNYVPCPYHYPGGQSSMLLDYARQLERHGRDKSLIEREKSILDKYDYTRVQNLGRNGCNECFGTLSGEGKPRIETQCGHIYHKQCFKDNLVGGRGGPCDGYSEKYPETSNFVAISKSDEYTRKIWPDDYNRLVTYPSAFSSSSSSSSSQKEAPLVIRCVCCEKKLDVDFSMKIDDMKSLKPIKEGPERDKIDQELFFKHDVDEMGTKLAHVNKKLLELLENEDARVIVFSQWDTLLKAACRIFGRKGISCAWVKGTVTQKEKALRAFTEDPAPGTKLKDITRVIMLSLTKGASGSNLTKATHVILLDPVGGDQGEAEANEIQAVGRAVRQHAAGGIGEDGRLKIVRFVMNDTLEHVFYLRNNALKKAPSNMPLSRELTKAKSLLIRQKSEQIILHPKAEA